MRSSAPSNALRLVPSPVARGVDGDVVDAVEESLDRGAGSSSTPPNFVNASLTDARNASRSRWRRDTPMIRVGSVNWSLLSRWKSAGIQFAIGEVAGAAENDEVERLDLDESCGHDASLGRRQNRSLAVIVKRLTLPMRGSRQGPRRASIEPQLAVGVLKQTLLDRARNS